MRRKDDRVVLRMLKLLIFAQLGSILSNNISFMLFEISLGRVLGFVIPISIGIVLIRELNNKQGDR